MADLQEAAETIIATEIARTWGTTQMLANASVNAWKDGYDVDTLVTATTNLRYAALVADYYDEWLNAMIGN